MIYFGMVMIASSPVVNGPVAGACAPNHLLLQKRFVQITM